MSQPQFIKWSYFSAKPILRKPNSDIFFGATFSFYRLEYCELKVESDDEFRSVNRTHWQNASDQTVKQYCLWKATSQIQAKDTSGLHLVSPEIGWHKLKHYIQMSEIYKYFTFINEKLWRNLFNVILVLFQEKIRYSFAFSVVIMNILCGHRSCFCGKMVFALWANNYSDISFHPSVVLSGCLLGCTSLKYVAHLMSSCRYVLDCKELIAREHQ